MDARNEAGRRRLIPEVLSSGNEVSAPCLALIHRGAPAMAQSLGERTGVNSTLGIAPKTEDFVKQVPTSDMFEIQSSKIAQERGNADQKAGTIVKDHQQSSADLMALAGE